MTDAEAGIRPQDAPRVLLLPQNDQHLETTRILAPALRGAGLRPEALLMDGAFHQGLAPEQLADLLPVRRLVLDLQRPFYRMGPLAQLVAVGRAIRPMRRVVGRPAAVLAFNDGALQRLAIRLAGGARTAILVDGMISAYGRDPGLASLVRSWVKRAGLAVRGTPLGIVLPSDVGLSPVDAVLVLGEHSAEVLRAQGSRASRVLATGLPRWPHPEPDDPPPPAAARRVLYLTAAFAWHAHHAADAAQAADVRLLADACAALDLELLVRVHPRDDERRWRAMGLRVIAAREEPMRASILAADVVLAMVSTGLLEAISLHRVARSLLVTDDFAQYAESFVADPVAGVIRSGEDLQAILAGYRDAIPAAAYVAQRAALLPYVAASGPEAATRVAAAVAELVA